MTSAHLNNLTKLRADLHSELSKYDDQFSEIFLNIIISFVRVQNSNYICILASLSKVLISNIISMVSL